MLDDPVESTEPDQDEFMVVQLVDSGQELYVCSECGSSLTEIPNYARYYCQNCGLHY